MSKNPIYTNLYRQMALHGTADDRMELSLQFETGPLTPERVAADQPWWDLQLCAVAHGRYEELRRTFADFYPQSALDDLAAIEELEWLTHLALSTAPGAAEWVVRAHELAQKRPQTTAVAARGTDESFFTAGFFDPPPDPAGDTAELDSGFFEDDFFSDDFFADYPDGKRDDTDTGETADTLTDSQWEAMFMDDWDTAENQAAAAADHHTHTLSEIPLDRLEEALGWLDRYVTRFYELVDEQQAQTAVAETGPEPDLEEMGFEDALDWFEGTFADAERQPAAAQADDTATATAAYGMTDADRFYEPFSGTVTDNLPPQDPAEMRDWLRHLLAEGDTAEIEAHLDDIDAWLRQHMAPYTIRPTS